MTDKLKLSALDADDLGVISAAIQDSLVAVRDCAFFAAERRFVLLLNRFRWEADASVDTAYWRTHSALVFNAVRAVHPVAARSASVLPPVRAVSPGTRSPRLTRTSRPEISRSRSSTSLTVVSAPPATLKIDPGATGISATRRFASTTSST